METLKKFPVHHVPHQIFVSNEVRDPNLKYNPIPLQQMQQTYWSQVKYHVFMFDLCKNLHKNLYLSNHESYVMITFALDIV